MDTGFNWHLCLAGILCVPLLLLPELGGEGHSETSLSALEGGASHSQRAHSAEPKVSLISFELGGGGQMRDL